MLPQSVHAIESPLFTTTFRDDLVVLLMSVGFIWLQSSSGCSPPFALFAFDMILALL